jgi:zinc/manganese transport system substrate-binding protein/manganese/iron transport system substrate-binding protein
MTRLALLGLLAIALAGCGGAAAESGAPRVVATTTQLADMARNVAPAADVTTILSANADPHEYEVRPHDVKALARADLVLRSGGETDEWLEGALDSAGVDERAVVDAGAAAGIVGDDPHWWQDPRRAERAAAAIGRAIPGADPAPYARRLRTLDAAVERCLASVPRDQRRLVTSHDALGYFARRYGLDVVGAVIPGGSTFAQPSAGEVAGLVDTIRRAGVRTIFAESSVNPKVERAIAHEAGARVGPPLWVDSLGPEGTPGATYIGSIAANTRALVEGFTGRRPTCRLDA